MRPSFFHHLHPPTIPAAQSRLRYTLGAGGLSVFLCLIIALSGMLEMFFYVPTPPEAGPSVQVITFLVPFGAILRNLHYWSSQLLVVTSLVHLLRVIFTGAYAPPRRFNYLLGLILLPMILFLDFTGYVLRWDEGVHWALVAGTNLIRSIPLIGTSLYGMLVGGGQPGPATLTRFYAWHLFGLTLVVIIIGTWHIFRVRRDGGIAVPPPELRPDALRITRFVLFRREAQAALLAIAFLLLLSAFLPAPLAPPIGEQTTLGADARAPWFFLWVQQLLKLGNPFIFGVLIPLLVWLVLALFPYLLPTAKPAELGRWFPAGNRVAQALTVVIVLAALSLTLFSLIP